jgi:hypothetical protein
MIAVGMFALGGFIGFVISFCLLRIQDWRKGAAILSGALSAAIAGGLFTFIKMLETQSGGPIGNNIFYYPIGLAYGVVTTRLEWLGSQGGERWVRVGHVVLWIVFSVLIGLLFLSESFRSLLPASTVGAVK